MDTEHDAPRMSMFCHVPWSDSIGVCGASGDSGTSGHGADCDCVTTTTPNPSALLSHRKHLYHILEVVGFALVIFMARSLIRLVRNMRQPMSVGPTDAGCEFQIATSLTVIGVVLCFKYWYSLTSMCH